MIEEITASFQTLGCKVREITTTNPLRSIANGVLKLYEGPPERKVQNKPT